MRNFHPKSNITLETCGHVRPGDKLKTFPQPQYVISIASTPAGVVIYNEQLRSFFFYQFFSVKISKYNISTYIYMSNTYVSIYL